MDKLRAEFRPVTAGYMRKALFLYLGSALAVEGIKYLIDYGGRKNEEAECRKIWKQIDEEWKRHDELWEKLD